MTEKVSARVSHVYQQNQGLLADLSGPIMHMCSCTRIQLIASEFSGPESLQRTSFCCMFKTEYMHILPRDHPIQPTHGHLGMRAHRASRPSSLTLPRPVHMPVHVHMPVRASLGLAPAHAQAAQKPACGRLQLTVTCMGITGRF